MERFLSLPNLKMGTQRTHASNSISMTYVRSDFKMGTQRAHAFRRQ
nr:MAG TPA: hypothetical protein [Bacteriophage sp.]